MGEGQPLTHFENAGAVVVGDEILSSLFLCDAGGSLQSSHENVQQAAGKQHGPPAESESTSLPEDSSDKLCYIDGKRFCP